MFNMAKNLKDKKKQTNKQKNIELKLQGFLVSKSMRCMDAFFKKLMALLLRQQVKNLKKKEKQTIKFFKTLGQSLIKLNDFEAFL